MKKLIRALFYSLSCGLLLSPSLYAEEFFDPTVRPKNIYRKKKQFLQLQELKLEMIVFTRARKFVIINKKSYRMGDIIANKFKLLTIARDHILIEYNKEKHKLSLTKTVNRQPAPPIENAL